MSTIIVDSSDIEKVIKRLDPIFDFEPSELMTALGALGETQFRRRIEEEKTAPDGTPWPDNWAETPILVQTGQHLLYSITYTASADEAEWGSTWEYAHVHNDGAVIEPKEKAQLSFTIGGNGQWVHAKKVTIPKREFAGISADNEQEMLDLISDFFGVLQ